MSNMRMDLIDKYYNLYKVRRLSRGGKNFRTNYEDLSELWNSLTREEQIAVNTRFSQENTLLD